MINRADTPQGNQANNASFAVSYRSAFLSPTMARLSSYHCTSQAWGGRPQCA
ncbi:hypothetical protein [Pantoea anthophila]|uniref:hypothetical protein n=1 Tax=Pantoea anthophila TaxID=470931 RepID=UPI0027817BEC|nr:hypothetical protein [Pantoea anthophila]MDQ1211595.1 hypothetical protein [Pantoea anthophila]